MACKRTLNKLLNLSDPFLIFYIFTVWFPHLLSLTNVCISQDTKNPGNRGKTAAVT